MKNGGFEELAINQTIDISGGAIVGAAGTQTAKAMVKPVVEVLVTIGTIYGISKF